MKSLNGALFLILSAALATGTTRKSVFGGEISDSQCAMNVHSLSRSHEEMTSKKTMGTDAASCAKACVRRGGEWVLRSGEKVYRLKNQTGAEEFSGKKVKVLGTLDDKTDSIDNSGIEEVKPQ